MHLFTDLNEIYIVIELQ